MPPKQNKNLEVSISNHITQTIKDLSCNLDERFDRNDVNLTSVNINYSRLFESRRSVECQVKTLPSFNLFRMSAPYCWRSA